MKLRLPLTGALVLLGVGLAAPATPAPGPAADPLKPLLRILGSAADYKQRLSAALGLARHKDSRAVPALIKALEDPHHTVRGTAARVLGTLGDQRARPALEALLLRAKNDFVRGQAQQALATLMALAEGKQPGVPQDRMQAHGTLGTLDRHSVQQRIKGHLKQAAGCFSQQLESAPYLGGQIQLKFRVAEDGSVKWVRIKASDIGSLEVERCILEQMNSASFHRPEGGEAEFSVPLNFGGGEDVVPLDPQTSAVTPRLRQSCKALLATDRRRVKLSPPAGLRVTLYLDPGGVVLSAGLCADGAPIPAEFSGPFVTNLKQLDLKLKQKDLPLTGKHGKLTYQFGCQRSPRGKPGKRRRSL